MPSNKTSIEIEAKGEFSQLTRGLRDVKSALGEVTKVVNTGARSGGFFSTDQLKSLDIFTRRFTDGMGRMTRLIDEQGEAITALYKRRRDASSTDIASIDKEIKKHGEYLDALEREREELERIYNLRRREASEFGSKAPGGGSGGGGGRIPKGTSPVAASAGMGLLGLGRGMKGLGGFIAGLAGVALSINQLMKWEQMAEQNISAWQPIIQRTGMSRGQMQGIGASRGYNAFQSAQALGIYTQIAGRIGGADAGRLMDFSRGYGVDVNTAAGIAGQMSVRGYGGAGAVLDRAAGVAEASNMQDRILEVLETSQGFLQSMDKNLKDNSGNSLLAYTARINQIGKEKGATKLTGQAGASLLEQMGNNIFNPSNVRWQTMGLNILSRYGGQQTKGMNSFDLMQTWQQGFQNPLNIQALSMYLDRATQGMTKKQSTEYKTLTLQEAMGGNTTLQQAQQFGELTNWLKEFNPDSPRMKELLKGVSGSSQTDSKAAQWKTTLDANIQISNAQWMNAQLAAGEIVIPTKLVIEDFTTKLLNDMTAALNKLDIGSIIAKKIQDALSPENVWATVGEVAGGLIAWNFIKKIPGKLWDLLTKDGGDKPPGAPPPPPGASVSDAPSASTAAGGKGRGGGFLEEDGTSPASSEDTLSRVASRAAAQAGSKGPVLFPRAAKWTIDMFNKLPAPLKKGIKWLGPLGDAYASKGAVDTGDNLGDWFFGHKKGMPKPPGLFSNPLKPDVWQDSRDPIWVRMAKSQDNQEKKVSDTMDTVDSRVSKAQDETIKAQGDMQKQVSDMASNTKSSMDSMVNDTKNTNKALLGANLMQQPGGSSYDNTFHQDWWDQLDAKNPSTWFNFTGKNITADGDTQQRVLAQLTKRGKGQWWNNTKWLVDHESSWDPNSYNNSPVMLDNGVEDHASGLFQFLNSTWQSYAPSGTGAFNPRQATIEQQTDAFINYMTQRYGGDFSKIKNFGTSAYKGYADGAFIARDGLNINHAGEEVISRSKTAEIQRKTGKLPSQALNAFMALDATQGASMSSRSGSQRIVVDVNVNGAAGLQGLPVEVIAQIARQVFTDAAYQAMRPQVQY